MKKEKKEYEGPKCCFECLFYKLGSKIDGSDICDKGVNLTEIDYKPCDMFVSAYRDIGRFNVNMVLERKTFEALVKKKIFDFIYARYGASECEEIVDDDIEMVWFSSVLGNMRALFFTSTLPFYAEATYNENLKEIYLDFYNNCKSQKIKSNEVINAIRHNKE